MIEQRVNAFEALGREELLGVQAAVGSPELNVALMGNAPFAKIRRHYGTLCSTTAARSVAANPFSRCVPSQNGLVCEPPQRQSAIFSPSTV